MKSLKALAVLASLFMTIGALSAAHGAGGIIRDGQVLSIGTSGIRISLQPLTVADLPELAVASQGLKKLILPTEARGQIQSALRPSATRKFFRVARISEAEERALVEEYRRIMPDLPDSNRFILLAFTDPEKKETYLLPSFFQLARPSQKAAVLFDEALQVSGLISSRKELTELETKMETALNCSGPCETAWDELQISLATSVPEKFANPTFMAMLQAAAVSDGAKGLLSGIISRNGDVSFVALLGEELTAIVLAAEEEHRNSRATTITADYRESRLAELLDVWPASRFLKFLGNCPYDLALLRYEAESRLVYSDGDASPTDVRLTSIVNWNYRNLRIKFSRKPLVNNLQINAYFLNSGFSEAGLLRALQPIDVNITTRLRKTYVLREAKEDHLEGCGIFTRECGPERWGWKRIYHYYLYGFALI